MAFFLLVSPNTEEALRAARGVLDSLVEDYGWQSRLGPTPSPSDVFKSGAECENMRMDSKQAGVTCSL